MNEKFFTPEKILLILHPVKFTEFYYYKYEDKALEERIKKLLNYENPLKESLLTKIEKSKF